MHINIEILHQPECIFSYEEFKKFHIEEVEHVFERDGRIDPLLTFLCSHPENPPGSLDVFTGIITEDIMASPDAVQIILSAFDCITHTIIKRGFKIEAVCHARPQLFVSGWIRTNNGKATPEEMREQLKKAQKKEGLFLFFENETNHETVTYEIEKRGFLVKGSDIIPDVKLIRFEIPKEEVTIFLGKIRGIYSRIKKSNVIDNN